MNNQISPEYTSSGSMIISVYTAGGALPVSNALVTITGSEKETSGVISVLYTDQSGNTPKITLPAPPKNMSESPGAKKPYATYNVDVDKDGFFPKRFINVPIFSGVTSVQPVNLSPFTEYVGEGLDPIGNEVTESQNPNL